MTELDEHTNSWLAEWEQKQAYFEGCTTITDYEKIYALFLFIKFY